MAQFSPICEVQSDKAAVEISSRYDGVITQLNYKAGDIAKVGSALVHIETNDDEIVSKPTETIPEKREKIETAKLEKDQSRDLSSSLTLATPAVRRVAKEHSLDLSNIKGTGPGGRILKKDILNNLNSDSIIIDQKSTPLVHQADKKVQLTAIQKAMFKSMTNSLSIPHFGYSEEICLNTIFKYRQDINSMILKNSSYSFKKISLMPIFLKAMSTALLKFPILNSYIQNSEADPSLVYRSSHNISIAMDTSQGYFYAYR